MTVFAKLSNSDEVPPSPVNAWLLADVIRPPPLVPPPVNELRPVYRPLLHPPPTVVDVVFVLVSPLSV